MSFATQFIHDDVARMYYEKDDANNVLLERPYTDEENQHVDAEQNRSVLRQQGLTALVTNMQDIARNDIALAVANPTQAQITAQVKELTRQSTYHAQQLNALIRLVLNKLD